MQEIITFTWPSLLSSCPCSEEVILLFDTVGIEDDDVVAGEHRGERDVFIIGERELLLWLISLL